MQMKVHVPGHRLHPSTSLSLSHSVSSSPCVSLSRFVCDESEAKEGILRLGLQGIWRTCACLIIRTICSWNLPINQPLHTAVDIDDDDASLDLRALTNALIDYNEIRLNHHMCVCACVCLCVCVCVVSFNLSTLIINSQPPQALIGFQLKGEGYLALRCDMPNLRPNYFA